MWSQTMFTIAIFGIVSPFAASVFDGSVVDASGTATSPATTSIARTRRNCPFCTTSCHDPSLYAGRSNVPSAFSRRRA